MRKRLRCYYGDLRLELPGDVGGLELHASSARRGRTEATLHQVARQFSTLVKEMFVSCYTAPPRTSPPSSIYAPLTGRPVLLSSTSKPPILDPGYIPATMSTAKVFAVIAGVGPGTGAAIARKFAKTYPVVLLARKEDSFKSLVQEIQALGQTALGIATDVASSDSVNAAFSQVREAFGSDASCAVRTQQRALQRYMAYKSLTGCRF